MATFKVLRLGTGKIQELTSTDQGNINAVLLNAGTAVQAPLVFTKGSSVLLTTPIAGAIEVDTLGLLYYDYAASARGVIQSSQFVVLSATYTLTSQTAAQKLFNASSTGAVTLVSGVTYEFECEFSLTAMSATSGSFGFAFGGTAVLGSQAWTAMAVKAALATATSEQVSYNTAANVTIATATTSTTGTARIRGRIRVTTGGTLIPEVSLGVAAAAVVGINSFFSIWPIGSNTVTVVGNWS